MFIAILQDGKVENELDVKLCCRECASQEYGWTEKQFRHVRDLVDKNQPIIVPDDVDVTPSFVLFIKTNIL